MLFHIMKSRDIRQNLATEYYLMNEKDYDQPVLLFYIQEPCVILGRNQSVYEEVNINKLKEKNIVLSRRVSGGGAVYDDLGNLSFSYILNKEDKTFGQYATILEPIVKAIKKLGVSDIRVDGRNDMMIGQKKISGNAMYTKGDKMFSHGTLLFDVDLEVLPDLLTVSKEKLASKGVKSVKSRVTNIKPYLGSEHQEMTTEMFRDYLVGELMGTTDPDCLSHQEIHLTAEDEACIATLMATTYSNDAWIYGASPEFTLKRRRYFDGIGTVQAEWSVVEGKLSAISLRGDFFGQKPVSELEEKLQGLSLYSPDVLAELDSLSLSLYVSGLQSEQLLALLTEVRENNDSM